MQEPFTIIDEGRGTAIEAAVAGGEVLISPRALEQALGWTLKPEGFCRDDVCIPVREDSRVLRDGAVDLLSFAALLGRPMAVDTDARVAAIGASARERGEALATGEEPNFALPDLDGRSYALSDFRGQKVFLAVWASW
jgi:hypothetical protein